MVYLTTKEWQEIYEVAKSYFSIKSSMYHYYGTASSNFIKYLQDNQVKYKKYFYVIRPLLACRYIKENNLLSPVLFSQLMNLELPEGIKKEILKLLVLKSSMAEIEKGKRIDTLNHYIKTELINLKEYIKLLQDDRKAEWDKLDSLFLKILFSL
ncbi:DNA polymerase beta superfamily protein [Herbinix luporum]|uniref:DNA polymerase beta superfamily protein n=1 Tax=Herbinix luporum TaxID=1679721 RepID=UPI003AB984B2